MDGTSSRLWKHAATILGFAFLALHISLLATSLSRRATVYAVINAESTDGASSLRTLQHTSWTTNNHYFPYGPFFYRLAHTLLLLDPVYQVAHVEDQDLRDRASHLALMEVSLFAALGLAYLLAAISSPFWFQGWATSFFLFLLIGSSNIWMAFTIDSHPDILLTFLLATGTWLLVWSADHKTSRKQTLCLSLAGISFGLGLSAKPSAIVFIGAACLGVIANSLWRGNGRRSFLEVFAFGISVVFAYFLIGFPQSIDFVPLYEILELMTKKTTSAFECKFWLVLWFNVTLFPLILLIAASCVFHRSLSPKILPWRVFFSFAIVPGVGLVSLFLLDNQPNRTHYILPVLAAGLVCLTVPIRLGVSALSRRCSSRQWKLLNGTLVLIASYCFMVCWPTYVENSASFIYSRFAFIEEALGVKEQIEPLLKSGKKIIFDFYVPYDDRTYSSFIPTRNFNKDLVGNATEAEFFVSSKWYYERFLRDESKGWEKVFMPTEEFRASRDLYMSLNAPHDFFLDGRGRRWDLQSRSPLGWEIWKRR